MLRRNTSFSLYSSQGQTFDMVCLTLKSRCWQSHSFHRVLGQSSLLWPLKIGPCPLAFGPFLESSSGRLSFPHLPLWLPRVRYIPSPLLRIWLPLIHPGNSGIAPSLKGQLIDSVNSLPYAMQHCIFTDSCFLEIWGLGHYCALTAVLSSVYFAKYQSIQRA